MWRYKVIERVVCETKDYKGMLQVGVMEQDGVKEL